MDKLTEYRSLIKKILTGYVELVNRHPTPELQTESNLKQPEHLLHR